MPENNAAAPPGNGELAQNQNQDAEQVLAAANMVKWGILACICFGMLPLHAYGIYMFSIKTILYGYLIMIVGAFYGLASIVLLLGIMVPPIMLVHWVYEVYNEPVPVAEQPPEPVVINDESAVVDDDGDAEGEWVDEDTWTIDQSD